MKEHPKWLNDLIQEGSVYLVGGPVRDNLLGIPCHDLDYLVTHVGPGKLQQLLEPHGKVHRVGKIFGVFKFTPNEAPTKNIDIALPRKEKSTGSGHREFEIEVDADIPIEIDLKRRDFTINAMAMNMESGELIDPYGGQEDLNSKLLRTVFDEAFNEDPLRMIRGVQFLARFQLSIEQTTLNSMTQQASLIQTVSVERIYQELLKLLNAAKPSSGFELMKETSLLEHVLPELQQTVGVKQPPQWHKWPVFEHTLAVIDAAPQDNLIVRLAALCHDLGKPHTIGVHPKDGRRTFWNHEKTSEKLARQLLKRLKAPEKIVESVCALCREHMFLPENQLTDKALRRLIHRVGPEHIENLVLLRRADRIGNGKNQDLEEWERLMKRVKAELGEGVFDKKQLKINGKDLIKELELKPGPEVGKILDELLKKVLDNPALNQRETLMKLAKKNEAIKVNILLLILEIVRLK